MASVTPTARASPTRSDSTARAGLPAPTHCAAAVVIACPTAQQGRPASVLALSPTPAAAATSAP